MVVSLVGVVADLEPFIFNQEFTRCEMYMDEFCKIFGLFINPDKKKLKQI